MKEFIRRQIELGVCECYGLIALALALSFVVYVLGLLVWAKVAI